MRPCRGRASVHRLRAHLPMIAAELAMQWRRPRTLATLGALACFAFALTIALALSGGGELQRVGDIPLLIVPDRAGASIPVIALASTMKFFLPLAVAIFAGEAIAGDAASGSTALRAGAPRAPQPLPARQAHGRAAAVADRRRARAAGRAAGRHDRLRLASPDRDRRQRLNRAAQRDRDIRAGHHARAPGDRRRPM